ncbi:hypothetical protein DFA_00834 [Cavenderia fasciculata]|uniref:Protein kinase domain-containing protein n=1 Tax=Cavenderia fasciculata TaxID=261658 RepID=F4PU39_CACFS|nr:uncharacterized protein DFA_00834 [Cavenderia fasciculata]EGG20965.1 hypothetical protein DFA_00834 [Cavenderia fasciculata]|eukprot:XP_004358815.1 hypothetical protein DFA_00834 [Cavenderia fasciculata]
MYNAKTTSEIAFLGDFKRWPAKQVKEWATKEVQSPYKFLRILKFNYYILLLSPLLTTIIISFYPKGTTSNVMSTQQKARELVKGTDFTVAQKSACSTFIDENEANANIIIIGQHGMGLDVLQFFAQKLVERNTSIPSTAPPQGKAHPFYQSIIPFHFFIILSTYPSQTTLVDYLLFYLINALPISFNQTQSFNILSFCLFIFHVIDLLCSFIFIILWSKSNTISFCFAMFVPHITGPSLASLLLAYQKTNIFRNSYWKTQSKEFNYDATKPMYLNVATCSKGFHQLLGLLSSAPCSIPQSLQKFSNGTIRNLGFGISSHVFAVTNNDDNNVYAVKVFRNQEAKTCELAMMKAIEKVDNVPKFIHHDADWIAIDPVGVPFTIKNYTHLHFSTVDKSSVIKTSL